MLKDKGEKKNKKDRKEETVELPAELVKELKKKAEECDEFKRKWMSVHADYENTCRRLEKERIQNIKFANEELLMRLFPIMDNFDMALDSMDHSEDKTAVLEGIKMVQKEFHKVLEQSGVKKIRSVGEEFDPEVHEAFAMERTEEQPDNTVLKEIRAGYKLNDRLIRPAQVIVAQEPEESEEKDKS